MKLYRVLTIAAIVLIGLAYYYLTKVDFVYRDTFTSPDGLYTVDLYAQKSMRPDISFSGESDNKKAYIILKNSQGNVLAAPSMFNSCHFVIGDFYLDWQHGNRIYFTKFNYVDLRSMKMNCM